MPWRWNIFIFNIYDIIWRLGTFQFKIITLCTATCFDRGAHHLAIQLLKTVAACIKWLTSQSPRVILFNISKIKLKHFLQLFKIFICKKEPTNEHYFDHWFNSIVLFSKGFEHPSVRYQEDCTRSLTVFYYAELIIKLYELSGYKILSWYSVTESIKYFELR